MLKCLLILSGTTIANGVDRGGLMGAEVPPQNDKGGDGPLVTVATYAIS